MTEVRLDPPDAKRLASGTSEGDALGVRPRAPEVTLPTDGAPAATRRVLLVIGEGHLATHALVEGQTLAIGREPSCAVALAHPKISRRHALLHVGEEQIEVEDLGSTNGTRLAGRALLHGQRATLEVGASLQLGPFVAVVLLSSGEAAREGAVRAALPIIDPTPKGVPDVVGRVAQGAVSVLITGETGAGKEVLARTIHELSGRAGQFVAINCASLSEALLESELFGHERGAFTGASAAKPGLFEVAGGGTVFLDEIGELPAGLQAKLLRVLETRTVYRVGGVKPVSLDVRFIAATHRNLAAQVATGHFRRDLYYRVNGIALAIEPLRARRDAIPALARRFLEDAAPAGRTAPRLGSAALEALLRHEWPGNVRELKTVMERAAVVCDSDEVLAQHVLFDDSAAPAAGAAPARAATPPGAPGGGERERILAALEACAGNQTYAARMLGISRTTLVNKLAVHRIPRPRKPRG